MNIQANSQPLDFSAYAHLAGNARTVEGQGANTSFVMDVNLKKYVYLNDHCFGGKSIVPATMIMELFIEAALCFSRSSLQERKLQVIALENLDVQRAIALNNKENLSLNISLTDFREDEIRCYADLCISSDRIAASGKKIGTRVNAKCTVVLACSVPTAPEVTIPDVKFEPYEFSPKECYKQFFHSHGPLFRSLTGRFQVSKDQKYLLGEYDCRNLERFFIPDNHLPFQISPLGYDSTLQYTVFLSRIRMFHGRLPVGGRRINIYRSHPTGGKCYVLVKCLSIDETVMNSDLVVFNESKQVIFDAQDFVVQRNYMEKHDRNAFYSALEQRKTKGSQWLI